MKENALDGQRGRASVGGRGDQTNLDPAGTDDRPRPAPGAPRRVILSVRAGGSRRPHRYVAAPAAQNAARVPGLARWRSACRSLLYIEMGDPRYTFTDQA